MIRGMPRYELRVMAQGKGPAPELASDDRLREAASFTPGPLQNVLHVTGRSFGESQLEMNMRQERV